MKVCVGVHVCAAAVVSIVSVLPLCLGVMCSQATCRLFLCRGCCASMATYSVPLGRSLNKDFVYRSVVAIAVLVFVLFVVFFGAVYYNERNVHVAKEDRYFSSYKNCPTTKKNVTNVHIICHTHDDVSWLKTFDQYYYGTQSEIQNVAVQYILDTVVDELLKNEKRRFVYVETSFFWRWWKEQSRERQEDMRRLVGRGQLEFAGGGWSMNDEATTSYQAIIDNFTWGFRKLSDMFGEGGRPKVGWQIDPFGASREQASIFAQFGFDGTYVNRIDFNEKAIRQKNRTAEFVWQASPNLGKSSDIFTNCMHSHYSAPRGFHFDNRKYNDAIVDDEDSPEYNVDKKAAQILDEVRLRKNFYKSSNVYLTMGDDFTYNNAISWFKNIDKIINYVNGNEAFAVNMFYSTPSCYVKAVNDENLPMTAKRDDFFPYIKDGKSFWTGYFTSRPTLKYLIRLGNNALQITKQLVSLSGEKAEEDGPLDKLRGEMGLMQHHDATTGTSPRLVVKDNVRRLSAAMAEAGIVTDKAAKKLLSKGEELPDVSFDTCLRLNASECAVTESGLPFVVTLYNPLSHPVTHYVRLPVHDDLFYTILNPEGEGVPAQLVPLAQPVVDMPGRVSNSTVELVFRAAELPPLGFRSYYVAPSNDAVEATREMSAADGYTIGDSTLGLTVDASTGFVKGASVKGKEYKLDHNFLYYSSAKKPPRGSPSGAYIFNPENPVPTYISRYATVKGYTGSIVSEIHQKFSSWMSQVIRIYHGEDHIEFDWLVGPLDVEANKEGKEVISVYRMPELLTAGIFYTDSNGREMLRRARNQRPVWAVDLTNNTVAGNYYPVTSRITARDAHTQFSVLPDRPEGGASLHDGEVELMIHRNLLYDDSLGMDEELIETEFGKEIVVRGKHYLTIGPVEAQSAAERLLSQRKFHSAWTYLTPVKDIKFSKWNELFKMEYSGLRFALPENIHILTLEPWKEGSLLFRLEHIMEKTDHSEYSKPVAVNIEDLFVPFKITSLKEMTLGGNVELNDLHRLEWTTVAQPEPDKEREYTTHSASELSTRTVILNPMEIRTFIIEIVFSL